MINRNFSYTGDFCSLEFYDANIFGSSVYIPLSSEKRKKSHHLFAAGASFTVVNRAEESIVIDGNEYFFESFTYRDAGGAEEFVSYPDVNVGKIDRFIPFPINRLYYDFRGVTILKEYLLSNAVDILIVRYSVVSGDGNYVVRVKPLLSCRPFNKVRKESPVKRSFFNIGGRIAVRPFSGFDYIYFYSTSSYVKYTGYWYNRFYYTDEAGSGEDLYNPFRVDAVINKENDFLFGISLDELNELDLKSSFFSELEKKNRLFLSVTEYFDGDTDFDKAFSALFFNLHKFERIKINGVDYADNLPAGFSVLGSLYIAELYCIFGNMGYVVEFLEKQFAAGSWAYSEAEAVKFLYAVVLLYDFYYYSGNLIFVSEHYDVLKERVGNILQNRKFLCNCGNRILLTALLYNAVRILCVFSELLEDEGMMLHYSSVALSLKDDDELKNADSYDIFRILSLPFAFMGENIVYMLLYDMERNITPLGVMSDNSEINITGFSEYLAVAVKYGRLNRNYVMDSLLKPLCRKILYDGAVGFLPDKLFQDGKNDKNFASLKACASFLKLAFFLRESHINDAGISEKYSRTMPEK